jgi:formylglycine-generating enzyme required for sulfatase activity
MNRAGGILLLFAAAGALATADAPPQSPPTGKSFRDCPSECPEMVVVPPGGFLMGSPPGDTHQGEGGEERPQHRVTIRYSFAVGKFEVTRAEFAEFARDTRLTDPAGCNIHRPPRWPTVRGLSWRNTGFPQTDRDPVVCVSWEEAQAYTQWLTRKTGNEYRLLSEAEWEYAARGGTRSQAYWGDDPTQACRYANGVDRSLVGRYPDDPWENVIPCDDGYVFTSPVGHFEPNMFGLYDMMGNAFEWVADCSTDDYRGAPSDGSPRLTGTCSARMNRGGSWTSNPTGLRAAHRGNDDFHMTRVVDLGFRVARSMVARAKVAQ